MSGPGRRGGVVLSGGVVGHRVTAALRTLAAIVILASGVFLLGVACTDGMMGSPPLLAGSTPWADSVTHGRAEDGAADAVGPQSTAHGSMPMAGNGTVSGAASVVMTPMSDAAGGLGGMAGACLSFLMVVGLVGALFFGGLRRLRSPIAAVARVLGPHVALRAGPRLSQLCVLRT